MVEKIPKPRSLEMQVRETLDDAGAKTMVCIKQLRVPGASRVGVVGSVGYLTPFMQAIPDSSFERPRSQMLRQPSNDATKANRRV